MKVLVQRVLSSSVEVDNKIVGQINKGLMLLVGFTDTDTENEIDYMVDKIINQSLPLGIDEEVDQSSYQLEDGDMIIMSSDGVVENLIDNDLLEEFISNAKDLAPQQIVYEILNYTIKNQIKTKDDMTVIVLKISTRKKK